MSVPVKINFQSSWQPLVLVVGGGRFRIEVGDDFEPAILGELVQTLEGV